MQQPEGGIEERAGLRRVLWSNRRRILASTAALGLAALLAGTLVPPVHRVSIRIATSPEASARWTEPALAAELRAFPQEPLQDPSGIFAAWLKLLDTAAGVKPDLGAERLDDGSLLAWAEGGSPDDARRRAERIADRLAGGMETAPVVASGTPPSTLSVPSLEASVARAREALVEAQARVAEAEAAVPPPADDDAGRGQALDADRRTAEALRQTLRRAERFARDLPNASPEDAPPAIREKQEWLDWRDALSRRDKVAAQVADLSRTLLDGHPRMAIVRLRLSDLDAELGMARERLSRAIERNVAELRGEIERLEREIAEGEARLGVDAASSEQLRTAEAEREAARRTLEALEDALDAARSGASSAATVPVADQPASREISETERRPTIWPIVAGSATLGFLGSALYTVVGAWRLRSPPTPPPAPRESPVRGRRRGGMRRPEGIDLPERRTAGATFDITSAEDLIGGILVSGISRLLLVPLSAEDRSAGVEIVRRLALRGRQGALVDLSDRQLAARAMGVAPGALGVSDMIAGAATFAEIARRDFATQAEVFGTGQAEVGEAAFLAMERRNVIDFIERNYEATLVVCSDLPLDVVKTLLTPDSALVATVDARDPEAIRAGVGRLHEAGLADMILADGQQFTT